MSVAAFPPYAGANEFFSACKLWSPGSDTGAVWELQAALPFMAESMMDIANGWSVMVGRAEADLQGGLHPYMRSALTEVWKALKAAAASADQLQGAFAVAYADAIARQNTRGGQTLNV